MENGLFVSCFGEFWVDCDQKLQQYNSYSNSLGMEVKMKQYVTFKQGLTELEETLTNPQEFNAFHNNILTWSQSLSLEQIRERERKDCSYLKLLMLDLNQASSLEHLLERFLDLVASYTSTYKEVRTCYSLPQVGQTSMLTRFGQNYICTRF